MRKLTIYIARHKHVTDKSGNSEPCAHCTKEIKRLGIKKIVYVNKLGEIQKSQTHKYENNYICAGTRVLNRQGVAL